MSTDLEDHVHQSAASLLSGILGDLQLLVEQQFQLTRQEIEEELRLHLAAASVFALGMGVFFVGGIVFCLSMAHLLHWAALTPVVDPGGLPLWACHAVVAAVLFLAGGVLVLRGRAKFKLIDVYRNPATEIMQEHVR